MGTTFYPPSLEIITLGMMGRPIADIAVQPAVKYLLFKKIHANEAKTSIKYRMTPLPRLYVKSQTTNQEGISKGEKKNNSQTEWTQTHSTRDPPNLYTTKLLVPQTSLSKRHYTLTCYLITIHQILTNHSS